MEYMNHKKLNTETGWLPNSEVQEKQITKQLLRYITNDNAYSLTAFSLAHNIDEKSIEGLATTEITVGLPSACQSAIRKLQIRQETECFAEHTWQKNGIIYKELGMFDKQGNWHFDSLCKYPKLAP